MDYGCFKVDRNRTKRIAYILYARLHCNSSLFDCRKGKKGRIAFSIEHKPTGEMAITVKFIDDMEYPLLPLIIDLKKTIKTLIETNVLLLD